MIKKIWIYSSLLIFLLLAGAIYKFYPQMGVATGYAAKKVCSCTFATGREQSEVEKDELYFSVLPFVKNVKDGSQKSVTSTFLGLQAQTAVYRSGLGCVLIRDKDDYNVVFPKTTRDFNRGFSVPDQPLITNGTNVQLLNKAVESQFNKDGDLKTKQTTAVLVFHRDTLIAERYAPSFTRDMPQLGWSMTKSWMNAFAGLLVKDGLVSLDNSLLFTEWEQDKRNAITFRNLLNMESGLEWVEDYATYSDATRMLYFSDNVSDIPLDMSLTFKPGTHWYYSSGTTNIISRYFRNILGEENRYLTFLQQRLFDELDMKSAFIETDESGLLIGSSYGYATPRDWAKFGLLYLHDGIWNGKRILPEGWIDFTKTQVPDSKGKYGAHFWLNQNGSQYPDAPFDMYNADGFLGQYVFVIPSHDVVIVRMGTGKAGFDENTFLKSILASIPKSIISSNQ